MTIFNGNRTILDTRRLRKYYVRYNEFIAWLRRGARLPDFLDVPLIQVPDGASVYGVWLNPTTRSFLVALEHQAFDDVRDGEEIPDLGGNLPVTIQSIPIHHGVALDVSGLDAKQLIQLREQVNARLYDLERG